MTPKEKAIELYKSFEDYSHCSPSYYWKVNTKKCCLVAIAQIYALGLKTGQHLESFDDKQMYFSYWEEVRIEIGKM